MANILTAVYPRLAILFYSEIEGDVIKKVKFTGGCNGNLKGVARLTEGMKIDDVIEKLSGIECGYKGTSCPDQFAKALREYKERQEK